MWILYSPTYLSAHFPPPPSSTYQYMALKVLSNEMDPQLAIDTECFHCAFVNPCTM
jgi:hypothetical protein